ncbi:target of Myb protein 1-like [Quillaja saponaria]|uniref:Target of Myb protein 1-like n=1 Tax=Quillaja saponaria TaxID=32244 RepID=A0AAD7LNG3_QUISA|nr:target of Myb protein 1-like [Quillaja saponaria]
MASSSSATVAVEKATSDLLISPDWTMNIDICDSVNSNHWQAKDVVKAVKKRLQHKSSKVQFLSLTLLETMVKNCGDYVHFQIVEKNILGEMIKIVKKKADMQVRDKILVLLDSWQEAFGGPGGKHPQYYWAYEELRRSGVVFPKRSSNTAPIFTPPIAQIESLSLSSLDSMRDVMELLRDMLQAINPNDKEAVKDEVIVDLVNRCRANQKKLMQMLTTTGDEELLGGGLELNDSIQSLLAKHDAIASGSSFPTEVPSATMEQSDEEEDEFAQLARRHSKTQPMPSKDISAGPSEGSVSTNASSTSTSYSPTPSTSVPCNALALPDPPAPVRTTKEQDMIDLLSITLSVTSASPHTPQTISGSSQNMHQAPVSPSMQGYPHTSQAYPGSQVQATYNSYVVPWAQPQTLPESHSRSEPQPQLQSQPLQQSQPYQHQIQTQQPQVHPQPQPHSQQQLQPQPSPNHDQQLHRQSLQLPNQYPQQQPQTHPNHQQSQLQTQQQLQNQYPQYPPQYPPPPWAATPGYSNNQNHLPAANMFLNPRAHTAVSNTPVQGARPLQHYNSFTSRGINGSANDGDQRGSSSGPNNSGNATGQKPFVPSYRLFEDLNVFGNVDGRLKTTSSSASSSLSGAMGPGMVGGRK